MRNLVGALILIAGVSAAQDELRLVKNVQCEDVFGPGVYETSGIVEANGRLHVVFDNLAKVGSLGLDLDPQSGALSPGRVGFSDYEAIAFDEQEGCFYVAIEGERVGREAWRPRILRLNAAGEQTGSWPVERPLHSDNKGVEGLTLVRRGGKPYLLALMEGNHGSSSDRGRDAGNGIVLVLGATADGGWAIERELKLPPTAKFVDYAGIDVDGERIAVVSQSSSALWIGELKDDWTVSQGRMIPLPKQADGSKKFGRIEGVVWLSATQLAMCSDQERPRDRGKGRLEQAVHVFELIDAPAAQQPVQDTRGGLTGGLGG